MVSQCHLLLGRHWQLLTFEKTWRGAGEMTQWVKALVDTGADDLSLAPGTYMVEGES